MIKRILVLSAVVVGVLVLVAAYLISSFDPDQVGQAVLSRLGEAADMNLQAEKFSLSLVNGLEAERVSAEGQSPSGRFQVEVERLYFAHRLRPLLAGTISVEKILIESPRITYVSQPGAAQSGTSRAGPPSGEGPSLRLEITEVSLSDGYVRFQEPDENGDLRDTVVLDGLSIGLQDFTFNPAAPTQVRRISGNGTLRVRQGQVNKLALRNLEAQMTVQEGVLVLKEASVSTDYGALNASLTADFNESPFTYQLTTRGEPIDVNRIAGLEGGELGPGRLEMEGSGAGIDSRELSANGNLVLADGKLPGHPVLQSAARALGLPRLVGARYTATEAPFTLADNRLTLESFALQAEDVGLDLAGWVDLEGPLDMIVGIRAQKESMNIPRIPPAALDAMADQNGWVRIPVRVTGTTEDPSAAPEMQSVVQQGVEGASRLLKGVLGGRQRKP